MSLEYVTNPEQTFIFRGDEIVADIVDGKCKMRPEFRKYAIGAGKFWKAFTGSPVAADVEPMHVPAPQDTVTEAGFVKHGEKTTVDASIPPCPPMDPLLGTKTEAVVEWFKKYQPDAWRKMHLDWQNR